MTKYFLEQKKDTYSLVKSDDHDFVLRLLMKLVMSKGLYTIISDEEEVSIMIDTGNEELKNYLCNTRTYSTLYTQSCTYNCVEISTNEHMLNESGMLAEITSFFASHNIPILLLSTYSTNYVFYSTSFTKTFVDVVNKYDDYELSFVK